MSYWIIYIESQTSNLILFITFLANHEANLQMWKKVNASNVVFTNHYKDMLIRSTDSLDHSVIFKWCDAFGQGRSSKHLWKPLCTSVDFHRNIVNQNFWEVVHSWENIRGKCRILWKQPAGTESHRSFSLCCHAGLSQINNLCNTLTVQTASWATGIKITLTLKLFFAAVFFGFCLNSELMWKRQLGAQDQYSISKHIKSMN